MNSTEVLVETGSEDVTNLYSPPKDHSKIEEEWKIVSKVNCVGLNAVLIRLRVFRSVILARVAEV